MKRIYTPEGLALRDELSARYFNSYDMLEKAIDDDALLEARAVMCDGDHNLIVDMNGLRGLIPRSECAYNPDGTDVKDIAVITRVGKSVCFKVFGFTTGKNGEPVALLSRRAAQKSCYLDFVSRLVPGDIIDARVTHFENFGAFVDIGCGIISLLSIDCMSVSRISHPSDRFELGQWIRVAVKCPAGIDGRLTLTHKELLGTWQENREVFSVGQTVMGIIRSIESYGIFVELAPNLAGLAELKQGVSVGSCAAVYIKSIIPSKMRIKLAIVDVGMKEAKAVTGKYFVAGDHMDTWQYSPAECERIIRTDFSRID